MLRFISLTDNSAVNTKQPVRTRPRRAALVIAAMSVFVLVASGCVVGHTAYPIETFTEMHYSQAYRSQQVPRLDGVDTAVAFAGRGVDQTYEVVPPRDLPYDRDRGAELYRVNCAVCHGIAGDGAAAPHITASWSVYATDTGNRYNPPPNLLESRTRLPEEAVFGIITNGIVVMPRFGPLLDEHERWDIVHYIYDLENGLGQ